MKSLLNLVDFSTLENDTLKVHTPLWPTSKFGSEVNKTLSLREGPVDSACGDIKVRPAASDALNEI